MEIIYFLLPLSLIISLTGLYAFFWAIRSGQYDDTDTPQYRVLFDDEEVSVEEDLHAKDENKL